LAAFWSLLLAGPRVPFYAKEVIRPWIEARFRLNLFSRLAEARISWLGRLGTLGKLYSSVLLKKSLTLLSLTEETMENVGDALVAFLNAWTH